MILIITAQFNSHITAPLQASAIAVLKEAKEPSKVIEVPGAVEIPIVASKYLKTGNYTAAIALGCVIEGDTDHYDLVTRSVTEGLTRLSLDLDLPIIQGVLACHTFDQAWSRRNLGASYARTVLHMVQTLQNPS